MKNQQNHQKESSIKPIYIGIGFTLFAMLVVGILYLSKPNSTPHPITQTSAGIDQFMNEVHSIKSGISSDMNDYKNMGYDMSNTSNNPMMASNTYSKNEAVKELYSKTAEELKADLLRPVQRTDRSDFYQELETIFQVREHQDFFQRQIGYAQLKLDLAVVGMGIIRVDEVLKGENATVQEKDQGEFIKYIRDQVQSAVASNDANFKAIVFKGLESSSS